jgi:hypothetical protein
LPNVQLRSLALALLALASAPLALAGCVDMFSFDGPSKPEPQVDPPPSSEAEARFTRDVYPILAARCASCHSESSGDVLSFVSRSPDDAYARILAFPNVVGDFTPNAPILSVPAASHKGVTYTSGEQAAIVAWLEAEIIERGGVPPPPPPSLEKLIQTWSGCLDYNDFLASNMTPVWNAILSSDGQCKRCHTTTAGGFAVNPDPMEFFRLISTQRATLLTFFRPDPALTVMLANHPLFESVGGRVAPHNLHPAFPYTDARTALTALTNKTTARLKATPPACSPPRL